MPNEKYSIEYQKGYQDGFKEGQTQMFKLFEKQLRLAYMSRPIVIKILEHSV